MEPIFVMSGILVAGIIGYFIAFSGDKKHTPAH
jgi:hypothetical protein